MERNLKRKDLEKMKEKLKSSESDQFGEVRTDWWMLGTIFERGCYKKSADESTERCNDLQKLILNSELSNLLSLRKVTYCLSAIRKSSYRICFIKSNSNRCSCAQACWICLFPRHFSRSDWNIPMMIFSQISSNKSALSSGMLDRLLSSYMYLRADIQYWPVHARNVGVRGRARRRFQAKKSFF